jgi:hypothetical protein
MSISRPEWPWYVAEYVVAEVLRGKDCKYSIHSYLINAGSAERAHEKAMELANRLSDSTRNGDGEVIEYRCEGLFNLDTLQMEVLEEETHLSVIHFPSGTPPHVRNKHELSLFSTPC